MDLNEYQKLAMRTSPDGHDRIKNGCLGLIGESGEIADVIKKWMFQSIEGTPLPVDKLIDEMGDVLWYCAEMATGAKLKLQNVANFPSCQDLYSYETLDEVAIRLSFSATQCGFCAIERRGSNEFHLNSVYKKLVHLCRLLGTTIEHVAEANIEKLKKRYPDGFDPERSMNRLEYQHKEQTESAPGFLFNQRNKTV